jgi:hypothetical protein
MVLPDYQRVNPNGTTRTDDEADWAAPRFPDR